MTEKRAKLVNEYIAEFESVYGHNRVKVREVIDDGVKCYVVYVDGAGAKMTAQDIADAVAQFRK